MAFDIAELSVRKETLEARLAADELRRPDDPPPQILVSLLEEIGERMRRLVQFAGPVGADLVVDYTEPGFWGQIESPDLGQVGRPRARAPDDSYCA